MTTYEENIYDTILEYRIATAEEINLVRCICSGSWEEILNNIIYARTGYHDLDQFFDCEFEEE